MTFKEVAGRVLEPRQRGSSSFCPFMLAPQILDPNELLGQCNMLLVVPDESGNFQATRMDFRGIQSRDFALRGTK